MGILSGLQTLSKNTLFPAGYVLIANVPFFQKLGNSAVETVKALPWGTNMTAWEETVRQTISTCWQGASTENFKALSNTTVIYPLYSAYSSCVNKAPVGAIATAATILSDHYWTIMTAAALGATFTVVNAVLKNSPYIKEHPVKRALTSFGLAGAAVYYGAGALDYPVSVQTITDVATNVLVVGGIVKVLAVGTIAISTLSRESSEGISKGWRWGCNAFIYAAGVFNWGGLPKGPAVEEKEEKKTPKKAVAKPKEKTPAKEKKEEERKSEPLVTPKKEDKLE